MTVPDEAVAAGVQAALSLYPDGHLDRDPLERDVRAVLEAAAPTIAAASIASHEHTWVRCEKCLSDGPCPCSGGICCPGEQREIEERAEGAAAERERIRQLSVEVDAFYDAPCPDGYADCVHQDTPFADLLSDPAPSAPAIPTGGTS